MKISQLVATKNTKQYHESVASRLPRGVKSQQQLLNLGYSVAVHDLGLSKAKTLDENFAANLINSYHNQSLNEGVGSFLGKVAGNVVGGAQAAGRGLKGAWADAKQGYADAKAKWDEKPAAGTAPAPAAGGSAPAGGAPAPAGGAPAAGGSGGSAPAGGAPAAGGSGGSDRPYVAPAGGAPAGGAPAGNTGGDLTSIMQAIDKLDKPSKQQLAGDLEKSIAATPEPEAEKPDELDAVKKNAGLPTGTPPAAPGETPAAPQYTDAERAAHKAAGGKYDNKTGQMIPPTAPAGGETPAAPGATPPATPAPGATPPATPAPGATPPATPAPGATPPAPTGGKMTQAQQDAMKARLQGQRAAGKTTASQTGAGFKNYVGGSEEKMTGVDASGAPVFKKLQRESVAFSNFLGVHI